MSISLERFTELKKRIKAAEAEADKAQGAFDQIMKDTIEGKHGCRTLKQAEKLLEKYDTAVSEMSDLFELELKHFEEEFPDE